MIDLHTHLLPEWDDGAKDWEETRRMAEIAAKDGVETIVMTPTMCGSGPSPAPNAFR